VMLTSPVQPEGDIVLVASYGGDEKHPAWYLNLQADPNVTITMDGRTFDATARTATPEEKAELWPQITSEYKGYAGYQKRTDRDIPVVICTPVG
jgi:deazaflavin-dependent oxidoreductase (nitroreductase family)